MRILQVTLHKIMVKTTHFSMNLTWGDHWSTSSVEINHHGDKLVWAVIKTLHNCDMVMFWPASFYLNRFICNSGTYSENNTNSTFDWWSWFFKNVLCESLSLVHMLLCPIVSKGYCGIHCISFNWRRSWDAKVMNHRSAFFKMNLKWQSEKQMSVVNLLNWLHHCEGKLMQKWQHQTKLCWSVRWFVLPSL